MSAIESILFRAMSEPKFAEQLFENPEDALAGYQLSDREIDQFKRISRDRSIVSTPEERKSPSLSATNASTRGKKPY